ncbi:MAG TPA: hypothetical protein VHS99_15745 [Chloroflexota bacterium]|nr:hypothetical protein [Chloroflexota bacterium]
MNTAKDDGRRAPETIELPAPTAWPMVTALGVALLLGGLVTHAVVSAVGLVLALIGGVGWWGEVLPQERVEPVPLRPPVERAKPVVSAAAAVEHLRLGEAGHRVRVPVEVQPYSAGIKGGAVGAVTMAVVALIYGLLVQGSLWYPINLLAGVAIPGMEHLSLEQLRAFNAPALIVATLAHGVVSVLTGLLYAVILPMLPRRHMLWGGVVAPLLWTGLIWAVLGVVNPALNARVDWGWFIASQIAFGLAAGFVIARAGPIATMQTWPLAARAGVEAAGMGVERKRER